MGEASWVSEREETAWTGASQGVATGLFAGAQRTRGRPRQGIPSSREGDHSSLSSAYTLTEFEAQLEQLRFPNLLALTSRRQFQDAFDKHGPRVYGLCTLAFDMLINTGGGEVAYFNYLANVRNSNDSPLLELIPNNVKSLLDGSKADLNL